MTGRGNSYSATVSISGKGATRFVAVTAQSGVLAERSYRGATSFRRHLSRQAPHAPEPCVLIDMLDT